MTVQMKDFFYYEDAWYRLLDVSNNRLLSCRRCAGGLIGGGRQIPWQSDCLRGSLAGYGVDDGALVFRGLVDSDTSGDLPVFLPYLPGKEEVHNLQLSAPGTVIPFTGHLIIYQGGTFMDSFAEVINANTAIELQFSEGALVGALDLSEFIQAGKDYRKMTPRRYADLAQFANIKRMLEVMREISPVVPRGSYSSKTYVWRYESSKCALCEAMG